MVYLIQGVLLGLYAAFIPGPFQAFLFAQTLRVGWKRTLPASFVPLISDGPIVMLFLLVLSEAPQGMIHFLKIAGGGFMLYLAWGAYQSFRLGKSPALIPENAARAGIIKAVLMNFLNPNVYIFWGTIGAPIVLSGWQESAWMGWGFLVGFYTTIIPAMALLITLFGTTNRLEHRIQKWIHLFLSAVLFLFGFYQIWQGIIALAS